MSFSELFIRRPVLSTVVSLMILLLGAQGILDLPVRQYPEGRGDVITVTTAYPGASADLIQGFITHAHRQGGVERRGRRLRHLEERPRASTVSVRMRLNADPNTALTEVTRQGAAGARRSCRRDAEDPVIVKGTGQHFALMYLAVAQRHDDARAGDRVS